MVNLRRAPAVIDAFGDRVRLARLQRGLTQQQLAVTAHVRRKFIGEIERGETNPSLESMVLVAEALGCGVSDLIPPDSISPSVSVRVEDIQRANDAIGVLKTILKPQAKRPVKRKPKMS